MGDFTESLSQLIGCSEHIKEVKRQIVQIASNDAPVCISGPSGVGKGLVAKLLHENDNKRKGKFIAINCGAIPSELLESEFFGHVKGSFTGATQDKPGLFQTANNGTLFLDEIGDLDLSMQVKLLRALQEKSIRPVGANDEIKVNVRIITATNKNLWDLVKTEKFRIDLFYRISVLNLAIKPLFERKEDILLISDFLLKKHDLTGKKIFSQEIKDIFLSYEFPGNIRELENIVIRAIALSQDNIIREEDIWLQKTVPSKSKTKSDFILGKDTLPVYLSNLEKTIIIDALNKCDWNQSKTAQVLGISLRVLRYSMDKLNINIHEISS